MKNAGQLRTGDTNFNNHNATAVDERAPFGRFNASGIGREPGSKPEAARVHRDPRHGRTVRRLGEVRLYFSGLRQWLALVVNAKRFEDAERVEVVPPVDDLAILDGDD